MANRIGFKEFLKKADSNNDVQLVVDANVIIALKDNKHRDNKSLREFLSSLQENSKDIDLFTTVTTKAEFLEYYRRKILTEGILKLYIKNKSEKILSDKVKLEIEKQVRARNQRQNREVQKQQNSEKALEAQSFDTTELDVEEFSVDANYFKDSEIKDIKKAFRGREVQNEMGWVRFCEIILLGRFHQMEKHLDDLCHYLTTRDKESLKYFKDEDVKWQMATQICGESGMGYSDAMILNMANHTTIKHILTMDFDLVYGGHISAPDKVIITPSERIKGYKNILKGV